MQEYKTEYKEYSNYAAIMISTDRLIFNEKSSVRARMIEHSKSYKELHIIIFSTAKFEPINISHNCTVYSSNSLVKVNYVADTRKLGAKILGKIDKQIPVLITCQDPFETALAGKSLANIRRNSELLLQIHTDLFSPYFVDRRIGFVNSFVNKVRIFISKFTLPEAQVIRVVSKKIADSLVEKGISADKIIVKPIEVNTEYIKSTTPAFDLHQRFPHFSKIILMVTRLESEKNVGMAIDAMKILNTKNSNAGLVIVGSGRLMEQLKKQAYNLKIEPKIAFMGWQTDLIPYYKGCDTFLVTSWYEGYGMVFKEAQAAGCRIVSTDVGIAREVGAIIVEWNAGNIADNL